MDVVAEQIVKKKMGRAGYALVIGMVLAMFLLPLLIIVLMENMGSEGAGWTNSSVIVIFTVMVGIYLLRFMGVEYEYSVANGVMAVEKIHAQRKRRGVVVVNIEEFERMGVYKAEEFKNQKFDTMLSCDSGARDEHTWFATFKQETSGSTLLTFSPDEGVLEAIKPYLKRQVWDDAFAGE